MSSSALPRADDYRYDQSEGLVKLQPPVTKGAVWGKVSVEPDPCWTLDSLISELNTLEIKNTLPPPSSPAFLGVPEFRDGITTADKNGMDIGKPFVMCISDDDMEDYEKDSEESYEQPLKKGTRFSCPDADFSAEALDSHLSLIQRDHEQRSQIEERRIKDDAALEEAKKREKALHEARVYQAKVEAEVQQEAARKAEERQKAALEAARISKAEDQGKEDEKVSKIPPGETAKKKIEAAVAISVEKAVEKKEAAVSSTITDATEF
ncbi:unnamed protein product [Spirodela intermedia]|uniref:Uncharacterized protein n=1 Tax=Spirodela intermedia TaxID=51605 RepID=A0A7I8IP78_SPIIN|nr:unnamed protein product [Spirodela intermedia]CAA6659570.1 unnamed protein product [Spirodela intermedia]